MIGYDICNVYGALVKVFDETGLDPPVQLIERFHVDCRGSRCTWKWFEDCKLITQSSGFVWLFEKCWLF